MTEFEIKEIKEKYPHGTRVQCISMEDMYHPIPCGTKGTVSNVDDIGTIHVKWDNGRSLGLIVGVDEFEKVD